MNVRIKTLDATALPQYQTPGACAFDLAARDRVTIAPKSLALIPTGLIVEVPKGHALILASRSSTPKKFGLMTPHGFGLIDQDYHGDQDELKVQVYNFTDETVTVEQGERVAQAFFMPVARAEFEHVEGSLREGSRGGFGSTKH